MELLDKLLDGSITGASAGVVFWFAVRLELKYLRRDVDAAHRRLNQIGAPAA